MVTYRTSYVGIDTRLRYNNYVSYVAQQQADAAKNTTRSYNWNERATLGYRNDWLEITLDGQVNSYAMLHVRYRLNMFGGKIDTQGRYEKKWGNNDSRGNRRW